MLTRTRWYAAVLLFQSQVGPDWDDDPIVDHQVRVFRATSAGGDYRRAGTPGTEGEHSYRNADGDAISWQFSAWLNSTNS